MTIKIIPMQKNPISSLAPYRVEYGTCSGADAHTARRDECSQFFSRPAFIRCAGGDARAPAGGTNSFTRPQSRRFHSYPLALTRPRGARTSGTESGGMAGPRVAAIQTLSAASSVDDWHCARNGRIGGGSIVGARDHPRSALGGSIFAGIWYRHDCRDDGHYDEHCVDVPTSTWQADFSAEAG